MPARQLESEQDAIDFGRELAAGLAPGAVVALVGGLGAGKTHVVKGMAAGLGYGERVTSPTFTLVHEYMGAGMRLPLFHFDFYRLDSADAVLGLGWDEYLEAGGICAVEWADLFPALFPAATQWWRLTVEPAGTRLAEAMAPPAATT